MFPANEKECQPGADYVINTDDEELLRLNTQHQFALSTVYSGRLIYDRSIVLGPADRVLDSGTGTGIWLQHLSKEVPDVGVMIGIDVTGHNFPSSSSSPNIHFQVASATKLPETWTGYFDLIHQRFLQGALNSSEWPVVLSEFRRALKPGGHLQLIEGQPEDMRNCGPAFVRLVGLHNELLKRRRMLPDCCAVLPQMLNDAGFEDIVSSKTYVPIGDAGGELGQLGRKVLTAVFDRTLPALLASGIVESASEYGELMEAAEREYDGPDAMSIAYWMFCARRSNQ